MKLTESARALLETLGSDFCIYARPSKTSSRDQLKRLGLIESYRPVLKNFRHGACWRITDLGRAALAQQEGRET